MRRRVEIQVVLVLALFALVCTTRHLRAWAHDLSSSYYGCRVLASGQPDHLYSRNPQFFDEVQDPVWSSLAQATHFSGKLKDLHPYVQTPLWAFALEPLCTRVDFPIFSRIFTALMSCCFAALLGLVARFWAPRLFHPGWMALVCLGLYVSEPYKYAAVLVQTHILFVLLAVGALMCAQRRPMLAGGLLAVAAAVKITPGFLLLYWLLTRRYRASASFAGFSAMLALAAYGVAGPALTATYLRTIAGVSNMLLVSWNNESLAALWMQHAYPASELYTWQALPLPPLVKGASLGAIVLLTAAGGVLDRWPAGQGDARPPYGAVLALMAATMFTPLAWVHYYVLSVVPLMLLLDAGLRRRSALLLGLAAVIFLYHFDISAFPKLPAHMRLLPLARSEFDASLASLAALAWLSLATRPSAVARNEGFRRRAGSLSGSRQNAL